MKITLSFLLLVLSTVLIFIMLLYISRKKSKTQIHYIFICNMSLMIIWCVAVIVEKMAQENFPSGVVMCEYFAYIGACFIPVTLLFTGLAYAYTRINLSFKHIVLFIIPTLTMIVLMTNSYHHLFYITQSINKDMQMIVKIGPYFFIHSIYSYVCIGFAIYYMLYFSIKNSGFFSKQAFLFICGTLGPVLINILFTLGIGGLTIYDTPTAFSFAMLCYLFAIFRYDFLNISPIALQNTVDRISDSFVVLNDNLNIVDYNKSFSDTFAMELQFKRNVNAIEVINRCPSINIDIPTLKKYLSESKFYRETITFEKHIVSVTVDKFYLVEITPIITNDTYIGAIILLKDITQSKKDLETIKENQAILLEQERLASLGQLIGGIAHNLKTPIMSIAGGIEALKDLVNEYEQSIEDMTVTAKDHHEIAKEMLDWLEKMKPYCGYMSDIISAVKGQAVQMNASSTVKFTVDELVKRVDLLMRHELKKYHCTFQKDFQINMNTEIKGEINNLVQVFDNIIMNSVQAYEGKEGIIDFKIVSNGDNIEFIFSDYAKGIPQSIADKLFKEMITTKGKNGTGLGLYMSYSTIRGRFGGNMTFTSTEGKGTTFVISIPCITYHKKEEAV